MTFVSQVSLCHLLQITYSFTFLCLLFNLVVSFILDSNLCTGIALKLDSRGPSMHSIEFSNDNASFWQLLGKMPKFSPSFPTSKLWQIFLSSTNFNLSFNNDKQLIDDSHCKTFAQDQLLRRRQERRGGRGRHTPLWHLAGYQVAVWVITEDLIALF